VKRQTGPADASARFVSGEKLLEVVWNWERNEVATAVGTGHTQQERESAKTIPVRTGSLFSRQQ